MRTAVALLVMAGAAFAQGKLNGIENFDEGLKKAKTSGKPIMLVFSAEW